jgi:hypothetical protein
MLGTPHTLGAGIATDCGLDGRGSEFESMKVQDFSRPHVVQTETRAHPASYPMDTGGSFPGGKATGAPS